MTNFRSNSLLCSQSRTTISLPFFALCIAACTSDIYPGADIIPEYFLDEREPLTSFVDTLQAETAVSEVWCVPTGTILGQGASEGEEFELSGELFETFNPHCTATQAAGAVSDIDGTAVVLEPAQKGTHYFRIDILRLDVAGNRKPMCGLFSYLSDESVCDIPLDDGWVARYRWDDSNDLKKLYD